MIVRNWICLKLLRKAKIFNVDGSNPSTNSWSGSLIFFSWIEFPSRNKKLQKVFQFIRKNSIDLIEQSPKSSKILNQFPKTENFFEWLVQCEISHFCTEFQLISSFLVWEFWEIFVEFTGFRLILAGNLKLSKSWWIKQFRGKPPICWGSEETEESWTWFSLRGKVSIWWLEVDGDQIVEASWILWLAVINLKAINYDDQENKSLAD